MSHEAAHCNTAESEETQPFPCALLPFCALRYVPCSCIRAATRPLREHKAAHSVQHSRRARVLIAMSPSTLCPRCIASALSVLLSIVPRGRTARVSDSAFPYTRGSFDRLFEVRLHGQGQQEH